MELRQYWSDSEEQALTGKAILTWSESTKKKIKPAGKLPKIKVASTKNGNSRHRRTRCKKCEPCLRSDCLDCNFCKDMKKYGGPGKMKQSCVMRQCVGPTLAHSAVCKICKEDGWKKVEPVLDQDGPSLMECFQCWEIIHPSCLHNIHPELPLEGDYKDDLPNSWVCPKCIRDGGPEDLKPRFIKNKKFKAEDDEREEKKRDLEDCEDNSNSKKIHLEKNFKANQPGSAKMYTASNSEQQDFHDSRWHHEEDRDVSNSSVNLSLSCSNTLDSTELEMSKGSNNESLLLNTNLGNNETTMPNNIGESLSEKLSGIQTRININNFQNFDIPSEEYNIIKGEHSKIVNNDNQNPSMMSEFSNNSHENYVKMECDEQMKLNNLEINRPNVFIQHGEHMEDISENNEQNNAMPSGNISPSLNSTNDIQESSQYYSERNSSTLLESKITISQIYIEGEKNENLTAHMESESSIPLNVDSENDSINENQCQEPISNTFSNKNIMLNIFSFLKPSDLLRCQLVCKNWGEWALTPQLWTNVDVSNKKITPYLLMGIVKRQPISLNLSQCNILGNHLSWLIARLPNLKHLNLRGCSSSTVAALSTAYCPYLHSLDIGSVRGLNDQLVDRLLSMPESDQIKGKKMKNKLRHLKNLNISESQISDLSIRLIAHRLVYLSVLNLGSCRHITDMGIALLSTARYSTLTSLDLTFCSSISDSSLEALGHCSNLAQASFQNCPLVTEEACSRLASKLGSSFYANKKYINKQ